MEIASIFSPSETGKQVVFYEWLYLSIFANDMLHSDVLDIKFVHF